MDRSGYENRITLCGVLMTAYFAIFPIHQTLILSNGSTVNKYVSFVIIVLLFIRQVSKGALLNSGNLVSKPLLAILFFSALSIVWASSRSEAISSVISLASYIALTILVCDTEWAAKEKKMFLIVLMLACTFYGLIMFTSQETGVAGFGSVYRSTFYGIEGAEADQNILAINISMGAVIAVRLYLLEKRPLVRYIALACVGLILLGVVSTGSRGGFIAFVAGMFIIFKHGGMTSKQRNRLLILFFLAIIAFVVLFTGRTSIQSDVIERFILKEEMSGGSGRINIWGKYLNIMLHKPYAIPFGFGTPSAAYSSYYASNWPPATHNDIINQFMSGGLVLVGLVFNFVKIIWKKAKYENNITGMACMAIVLIGGLTVNSFTRYGWWTAMIIGYIGMDWQLTEEIEYDLRDE